MSISNLFDHLPTPDNVVYISDYKHIQKAVLRDACELSGPQVTASRLEPILDFFNILPDPDEESEYKAVHGEFLTMDRLMMSCPGYRVHHGAMRIKPSRPLDDELYGAVLVVYYTHRWHRDRDLMLVYALMSGWTLSESVCFGRLP